MPRASTTVENAAANAAVASAAYIAVFTSDPGTTGASGEVSGGSYARQAVTWGSASGGVVANTNAISIPIPAGTTVTDVGFFSASTGGTYEFGAALPASQSFASAGTLTFAAGTLTQTAS